MNLFHFVFLFCLFLKLSTVKSLKCHGFKLEGPEGDGIGVTGGCKKPLIKWKYGKNSLNELTEILKNGNAYVRLEGSGNIHLKKECIGPVGPNLTIDGMSAKITIFGPKFIHLGPNSKNVIIQGLCFKQNDNAIDMTDGGENVWVTRNSFLDTSFGSPTAFRGYSGGKIAGTKHIHVSRNWYGPTSFGPGFFGGIDQASFYRNYMFMVKTRTPSLNTGTFHVCNNVIDRWDLGFQSHCFAHSLIEKNLLIVKKGWSSRPIYAGQTEGGDNTCGKDYERSTVCWKNNMIIGYSKKIPLLSGPNKDMVKLSCNFKLPFRSLPCVKIKNSKDFRKAVKKEAGVPEHWCHKTSGGFRIKLFK